MIKYHQNGIGNEYGADHQLTNNWNPDIDYGNEYVDIHFRIDANYYQYPYTGYSQEEERAFSDEVLSIFKNLGWSVEKEGYNGSCTTITKGKSNLYLHPQDFSGEVLKNDVKSIAEALEGNSTFNLRWVDLYKTVYDITDAEYNEYLETRKADIRKLLFEKSKTPRTYKYYYICDVMHDVAGKIRLERLGYLDGKNYGDGYSGETVQYIYQCAMEMIAEGFLKHFDGENGTYIRSINKTEQKAFKCFTA